MIVPLTDTEVSVLGAALALLERNGRVGMKALERELHWSGNRYAELKSLYVYWHMGFWTREKYALWERPTLLHRERFISAKRGFLPSNT